MQNKQSITLFTGIIISCTYIAFGFIGGIFTIPPGFASAIWPAAGIALAIYIKYGHRALPWLFIGSFFANLITAYTPIYDMPLSEIFWHAARSSGSILQLCFARYLIFRVCHIPLDLGRFDQILKLLILSGPLACIIAATIGAITLFFEGFVSQSMLPFVWFTWWVGDSIGVLFFLPITLLFLKNENVNTIENRHQVVIAALIMFTIVCGTFYYSKLVFNDKRTRDFAQLTRTKINLFNVAKLEIKNNLTSLAAIFNMRQNISQAEFAQYTLSTNPRTAKYRAMGWIKKVPNNEVTAWQDLVSKDPQNPVQLKRWTKSGLKPALAQEVYFPITYLEPYLNNKTAIGLNVASHPVASKAVISAINTAKAIATPPMQLAQQGGKYNGSVIYYPVYVLNTSKTEVQGLVEVVLEIDLLLEKLFKLDAKRKGYHYSITDTKHSEQPFISNMRKENASFNSYYDLDWFGRTWEVSFASSIEFENAEKDWLSWLTLILGLIVATLAMSFIMVIISFNSQLRMQVAQQTKQLKELIRDLEIASQAKSNFLSNMSHELRTPLTAIIGYIEIARNKLKEQQALDYFERINHSSKLLLNIINQILDIAKIESGKLLVEKHQFDLNQTISRLESVFRQMADSKGLTFLINTAPLPKINSDQIKIEQIATNLIGNAIKFTQTGKITVDITIKYDPISLLILTVSDTGIGISEKAKVKLFDDFEQADTSITRQYGGTGLGLSITLQLCELMGGEIEFESELEVGSRFTVSLPIEIIYDNMLSDEELTNQIEPVTDLTDIKILLVEDNQINQLVATELMYQFTQNIVVANNGQEAIDLLESAAELPQVILMDIQMPVMGGLEATKIIKANPTLAHIPIIALSANALTDDINKAHEIGIDYYITKPIELIKLKLAISEVLTPNPQWK